MGIAACGSTGKATTTAPQGTNSTESSSSTNGATPAAAATAPTETASGAALAKLSDKIDNDNDREKHTDDYRFGHAASPADRRAVTAVVKRYYTAAAAGDGKTACALSYSLFVEEIPELYGTPSGPPGLRGTTCPVILSKLFRQRHQQLSAEHATLVVDTVRVEKLRAFAVMSFKTVKEHDILLHREHRAWKIYELLDTELKPE